MLTLGEQQRQLDDILSIIVIKVLSIIVITLKHPGGAGFPDVAFDQGAGIDEVGRCHL